MFSKLYGIITISCFFFLKHTNKSSKKTCDSTDININDKRKAKTEYNQNNNGFENIL